MTAQLTLPQINAAPIPRRNLRYLHNLGVLQGSSANRTLEAIPASKKFANLLEIDEGSALGPAASVRPAVVMLHGRSGSEDDTWIFVRTIPKDWVVVAPQGKQVGMIACERAN